MPMALIQIEELAARRWHAEVEVGFPLCRKEIINAASFDEVMISVIDAYRKILPVDVVRPEVSPLPPIDESVIPELPPPPISKTEAQRMRDEADGVEPHDRTHCEHGIAIGEECPQHGGVIRAGTVAVPFRRGRRPRNA